MIIGVDLSTLQTPHRKRGVGSTLINFINNLPASAKKGHGFVFYMHDTDKHDNPLGLLDLSGIDYEVRIINHFASIRFNWPGIFSVFPRALNQLKILRDLHFGDSRIHDLSGVDHFLQFNQNQPVPAKRKVRSTLMLYDLIPYVLRADYLPTYSGARKKGHSIKGSVLSHIRSRRYLHKMNLLTKRATRLVAISETTKNDFIKYLGIKPNKINVCLLGVDTSPTQDKHNELTVKRYKKTGWGYVPVETSISSQVKFLLFSGGVDPRRHLVDLVAAFNNLRAQGHDVKLVMTGDDMRSPLTVPNIPLRKYFRNTSYLDDIFFLGFVNNEQLGWLYRHAVAFVYPSVYEGFGLPVLEAMHGGCPVICYKNSSVSEVAGEAAIFVSNYLDIFHEIKILMDNIEISEKYKKLGKIQASKYSWMETSKNIISYLA